MITIPNDQKRAFIAAAEAEPRMFGEIARAANLTLAVVFEIWAQGKAAGKLFIASDEPGLRYVKVVRI